MMMTNLPMTIRCRADAAQTMQKKRRRSARSASLGRRTLEVFEELAVRRDDDQVAILTERIAVRLQAAPERIELRVAVVRAGIDARRGRLAFAANALRIRVGLRDDLDLLAFRLGTDDLRFAIALAALRARDALEALLHALVHAGRDVFLQVDALHAHVDELDAEPQQRIRGARHEFTGDLLTIGDHDFLERAAGDRVLDAVLDRLADEPLGALFVAAAGRLVV